MHLYDALAQRSRHGAERKTAATNDDSQRMTSGNFTRLSPRIPGAHASDSSDGFALQSLALHSQVASTEPLSRRPTEDGARLDRLERSGSMPAAALLQRRTTAPDFADRVDSAVKSAVRNYCESSKLSNNSSLDASRLMAPRAMLLNGRTSTRSSYGSDIPIGAQRRSDRSAVATSNPLNGVSSMPAVPIGVSSSVTHSARPAEPWCGAHEPHVPSHSARRRSERPVMTSPLDGTASMPAMPVGTVPASISTSSASPSPWITSVSPTSPRNALSSSSVSMPAMRVMSPSPLVQSIGGAPNSRALDSLARKALRARQADPARDAVWHVPARKQSHNVIRQPMRATAGSGSPAEEKSRRAGARPKAGMTFIRESASGESGDDESCSESSSSHSFTFDEPHTLGVSLLGLESASPTLSASMFEESQADGDGFAAAAIAHNCVRHNASVLSRLSLCRD